MKQYPIVILPGWLLGAKRFQPLAKEYQKVGFKTYVVDFPGFEDVPPLTKVLNLTDYVKYLQKYLKQHRIAKAIFVCHSFGGRVALKLLNQKPDLAIALIISGTPGYPTTSHMRYYLTVTVAKIGKLFLFLMPIPFIRRKITSLFRRLSGSTDYGNTTGFLRETFLNVVREQLVDYMHHVKIPTLLVWGSRDRLVPVNIARKMEKAIRGAQLIIIPDKGHMFTYREPKLMVEATDSFLKSFE